MKFAEHLSAHITPEWRKQYINYEVIDYIGKNFVLTFQRKFFYFCDFHFYMAHNAHVSKYHI